MYYNREKHINSIKVLLNGITGVNCTEVARQTGLAEATIRRFMSGKDVDDTTLDKISDYIWRSMNADFTAHKLCKECGQKIMES